MRILDTVEPLTGLKILRKTGLLPIVVEDRHGVERNIRQWGHEVYWWDAKKVQILTGLKQDGVWVKQTVVVGSPLYMKRPWKICEATGRSKWIQEKIENLELYDRGFNEVVVAASASVTKFQQLSHSRVKKVRGQNVYFSMQYETGTARIPPFPILVRSA